MKTDPISTLATDSKISQKELIKYLRQSLFLEMERTDANDYYCEGETITAKVLLKDPETGQIMCLLEEEETVLSQPRSTY